MSANNGVIRITRKGVKKFAFGDGDPFDVDVVVVFQEWICIDETFREQFEDRLIPNQMLSTYHQAAVTFASSLSGGTQVTVAEALDFIARLRECYDELADFFLPRPREKRGSPDSSAAELRFSEEAS